MVLPAGVITVNLTFGLDTDDTGEPSTGGRVTLLASTDRVWDATGDVVSAENVVVPIDGAAHVVPWVATDQPGFVNGAGEPVIDWTVKAVIDKPGRARRFVSFALPAGGVDGLVVDFNKLVPVEQSDGQTVAVTMVTSVDGQPGAVQLAGRYVSFLSPSPTGDDGAQINAALNAGGGNSPTTVILRGGVFTVGGGAVQENGAYLSQPSRSTLVLMDATLRLANAAGAPAIMNANPRPVGVPVDTELRIVGLGAAVLDGNAANNPHIPGLLTQWRSIPWLYVGVTGWDIRDLTVKNPSAWGFSPQNTSNGKFLNVHSVCDSSTPNQSPIQPYGANVDLVIDVYGGSQDDGVALLTYTKQQAAAFVYPNGAAYPGGNMNRIKITMTGTWGTSVGNGLRLLCGDGGQIWNVEAWVSGFAPTGALVMFGSNAYVTTQPAPGDLKNIRLHINGSAVAAGVKINQSCSNVSVDAVLDGDNIAIRCDPPNGTATINDLHVASLTYQYASTAQAILFSTAAATLNGVMLTNCVVKGVKWLLKNAGAVTNLRVSNVRIGTLATAGAIVESTPSETGSIEGVTVGAYVGTAKRLAGAPSALRFGPSFPILAAGDIVPLASSKGSTILCGATLDPTGGAGTTGGQYVANGAAWVKAVDLGAGF